jgi:acid phosphatase (class A)
MKQTLILFAILTQTLCFNDVFAHEAGTPSIAQPATTSPAAKTPVPATPRQPAYVSATAIDLKKVLPAPPELNSLADLADLDTVLRVQEFRSPAEMAEATRDATLGPMDWSATLLGTDFTATNYPKIAKLLADIRGDMNPYAHTSPYTHRARPKDRDARVKPILPSHHGAYPSARATGTRIWAFVMGEIVPERKADFLAHADKSAWLRVVGGIHYPTDLIGGRAIGEAFIALLQKNPDFNRDLAIAKAEFDSRRPAKK